MNDNLDLMSSGALYSLEKLDPGRLSPTEPRALRAEIRRLKPPPKVWDRLLVSLGDGDGHKVRKHTMTAAFSPATPTLSQRLKALGALLTPRSAISRQHRYLERCDTAVGPGTSSVAPVLPPGEAP